ncbi:hypothetical protein CHU98_g10424 [Xylaria longipes]|nr:hypothetical protein CHU98_g10424 [Xylaria longipes]
MSTNSMATLVSSDGIEVQATYQAVRCSVTLGTMLELLDEEHTTDLPIPIPGVAGEALKKVVEWCERHRGDPIPKPDNQETAKPCRIEDLPSWDLEFFKFDKNLLIEVTNASNYLEIPLLLEYLVCVIADRLAGMTTEQMRNFLNIENDFSADEEKQIRRDNAWATDKP